MLGILGCHEPPPSQSGKSKPIPLNPLISLFTPSIAIFSRPITPLSGAFAIAVKLSKIPLKIFLTPSQASDQFPVNTPFTKSTMPENTVRSAVKILDTFAKMH